MSKKYVYGVDIGGTSIKLGLFDEAGSLVDKFNIVTDKTDGAKRVLPDISEAIKENMQQHKIDATALVGIGVGVPGPVLAGGVVNQCVNVGWGVKNVAAELSDLMGGIRVYVANDANVAALGEMWRGGGQGYSNVVMITLGTGVGGGIVVNGKIVSGAFGAAGELGHMRVNKKETLVCGCGKKGCLEQYASATGVSRLAKEIMGRELTAKDVFDEARAGDEAATAVAELMAQRLGRALALTACVVDPEVFVIGGGVSNAGVFLLDLIRKHYRADAFHASENATLALATLGNDAGIYGAARMMIEY